MDGIQRPLSSGPLKDAWAPFVTFSSNIAALPAPPESRALAFESRVLVAYVAAASLCILSAYAALETQLGRQLRHAIFRANPNSPKNTTYVTSGGYIARHGGWAIFPFQALRFLAAGALGGISIFSVFKSHAVGDVTLMLSAGYQALLSAVLVIQPISGTRAVSTHASIVGFAIFMAVTYRNLWPLLTFVYAPADGHEGALLWIKLALAAMTGVLLPLFEPFPYIPFDPIHPQVINPEQTASLASIITYSFLDPLIGASRHVEHLDASALPPRLDYDGLQALQPRISPFMDPLRRGPDGRRRKARMVLGMLDTFRASWAAQALLCAAGSFAQLASPIGTNRLLSYLEDGGTSAIVRPWVWIAWIALGPLILELNDQFFLYLNARLFVRTEALISGLVFDHALKVRVINAPDDVPAITTAPVGSPMLAQHASVATVPEAVVALTGAADSEASETATVVSESTSSTTHSRAESSATASTVVGGHQHGKKTGKDDTDGKKQESEKKKKVELSNLVTSDLANITGGLDFLFGVVGVPMQAALGSWFLYSILGWSTWVGLAVMVVLFPVPTWTAKFINGVQKKKMAATDARVKTVREALSILRMIKQFGWEARVKAQLDESREEELKWIFRRKLLNLVNMMTNFTIPLLHMLATFACYTLIAKKPLSAAIVFSALTGFTMLRSALFMAVSYVPRIIEANVSLGRVQDFLNETELLNQYADNAIAQDASAEHVNDIGLAQASFAWHKERNTDGMRTPSRQVFRLRIGDEVVFTKGCVNLIIGPTGCGKSSLLHALLGEMDYVPSGSGSWVNLPRGGGVAYCAQESWIQSMTIKDNILFGAPYEEQRYKAVVHQCGLKRDLSLFDAGDLTEIGEKGLTLSGGQKARIALARAVYSRANVLLLDDILAALDVHTSAWIVKKCLRGDLLKDRTVLLVTHNVALTAPVAAYVVSMGADGCILNRGAPSEILSQDQALTEEIKHEQEAIELEEELDGDEDYTKQASAKGAKLILAEEIERGHISRKAIRLFLGTLSPWPLAFWTAYLVGRCVSESAEVLEMWWLGYWARAYSRTDHVNSVYYMSVYAGIVVFILLTYCWCTGLFTFASVRASRLIHDRLTTSIFATTFRFLDTTPTSRIITRCTQDIQSIDGSLPVKINSFIALVIMCISRLIAIAFSAPWFIIPGLVIGASGGGLGQLYMKAQLSVKRERSNAKAPVLAVVTASFAGLPSIRAFGAQDMFTERSRARIDEYTGISIVFYNLNRWIAVRLQVLSSLFAGGLCLYLVYGPGHQTRSTSTIGFSLSMAVAFSGQLLYLVRIANQLEVEGNSLERIQSYIDIEHEPTSNEGGQPPAYWPASGDLRVENLTARYSSDGPVVLDKLSFHIRSGERVGIVGRTGSGKSTLTLALLRCILTEGDMFYDGLSTQALNLDALRSNITIIPQAPELIGGSLRKNLDMFGKHDDFELNDALRSAGLFSVQSGAGENHLTLDSQIADGGGNLSTGQRQIIALARAIVRQSKLLVLDEATSAIDYETDAVIQASLRTELKRDVTVITVAHRLQTVMDSDKIMVLDAGKLVEFDSPKALLKEEGSFLRSLVDESADKEALYAIAEGRVNA